MSSMLERQMSSTDLAELEAFDPSGSCEICGDERLAPDEDGDEQACPFCPRPVWLT